MLNSQALLQLGEASIDTVDPATLVNIDTVHVSREMAHEEKVKSFVARAGNPYCFCSGEVPIRVRFTNEKKPLAQSLASYFTISKEK